MATTVASKGQVTISELVRDLLGIVLGSKVEFCRKEDESVVLMLADPRPSRSRFSDFRGHAGKGLSTDEIMALTRG